MIATYRKGLTQVLSVILLLFANNVLAETVKHLCITEVSGGLLYKNGAWVSTPFKAGDKYLIKTEGDALVSVKEFGAPDEFEMTYCRQLVNTLSWVCETNFDSFRFQPSSGKFVMSKTSGFTSEFKEQGINFPPEDFTPNISAGYCETI